MGVVGDDFFPILLKILDWESVLDTLGDALSLITTEGLYGIDSWPILVNKSGLRPPNSPSYPFPSPADSLHSLFTHVRRFSSQHPVRSFCSLLVCFFSGSAA